MKILTVLLLISASACAQTAPAPTPPQGPLLNRAPIPCQWTVTFKLRQQAASATPAGGNTTPGSGKLNRLLTVTKEQDHVFERITTEEGSVIEMWHLPGCAVMAVGGKSLQFLPGVENNFESTDYSKSDFAGFDWVSLTNFTGRQDVMGRHCLVFTGNILTMDPREIALTEAIQQKEYGDKKAAALIERARKGLPRDSGSPTPPPPVFDASQHMVQAIAYIDDDTRLPVMLTYGVGGATMVRTYQFQPAPASLPIPPEVQKILDDRKARQQRQARPIAPI